MTKKEEKKLFVPYGIAALCKKYKFNESCLGYYENQDKKLVLNFNNLKLNEEQLKRPTMYTINNTNLALPQWATSAPTHQQVINWLREKHNKVIEVSLYYKEDKNSWTYDIMEYGTQKSYLGGISEYRISKDYYIALDKAIIETFKLLSK